MFKSSLPYRKALNRFIVSLNRRMPVKEAIGLIPLIPFHRVDWEAESIVLRWHALQHRAAGAMIDPAPGESVAMLQAEGEKLISDSREKLMAYLTPYKDAVEFTYPEEHRVYLARRLFGR